MSTSPLSSKSTDYKNALIRSLTVQFLPSLIIAAILRCETTIYATFYKITEILQTLEHFRVTPEVFIGLAQHLGAQARIMQGLRGDLCRFSAVHLVTEALYKKLEGF